MTPEGDDTQPGRVDARRREKAAAVARLLQEAQRHDRLAEAFIARGQRIAAALQRGVAMGIREACALLGPEVG